ncbi:O-methyltransferase [Paenibacillus larvae]|uniref:O-methyltransferase n=1 Tax=Paenibacillus larvae TaxID=1464 RepID=UPI0028539A77|nr:O-methyltransferase [Paenibacillus larvae]MDR5599949.1 O-methyltransferase [Paenibacillus larvae]
MGELTAEQYVEDLYDKDEQLERVKEGIRAHNMPEISIAEGYGRLLTMLVHMVKAERILEIGALGGYSGICLARGLNEGGKLYSLEIREEFVEVARHHVNEAGLGDKVEYRIGEALDSLAQFQKEKVKFDFFFIDADKVNYPNYLEKAIELANPGAVIIGDNILMRGRCLDSSITKKSVEAMRSFNRLIASHPRLESTILPAYDGLAIARIL